MQITLNLELLIKLMKLTTSSTDGEALAAIRMANSQLAKAGGDWEELLRGKLAPIDPFASLPEPPKPAPPKPPPQPQQTWHNNPTPPPPPRYYGLDRKEAKDIANWLVDLEFANIPSNDARQVAHITLRWKTNKQLDSADYTFIKTLASKIKRNRP